MIRVFFKVKWAFLLLFILEKSSKWSLFYFIASREYKLLKGVQYFPHHFLVCIWKWLLDGLRSSYEL